ncbi:MAG TPA: DUF3857 and transglutaminase domain-containing protein [bacterium]
MKRKFSLIPLGAVVLCFSLAFLVQAQDDPYAGLLKDAGSLEIFKDADVGVIFDSTNVRVENTGLSHVVNHRLLKVLTWDGARRFTGLRFDYDPASNVLEPRNVTVHRADGKVEQVDLSLIQDHPQPQSMIYWGARMKVLPIPRLNVGDAIEMETYKKGFQIAYLDEMEQADDERYIPPMRGHFYDVVTFQGDDPIREKVYTMSISRNLPAQFQVYNGEVFSAVTFEDTLFVYKFWKKDVPAFKHEPRQPDATDIVPKVVLATVKDWPEKSRWFFQVNEPVFAVDDDVRRTAQQIVRGSKTEDEKIEAVLHWTAQQIRYSGITMGKGEGYTLHPGIMTLHDRCGVCKDIAGMSITLLRALDFTVYPAMTMAGARVELIPADQFNHCVVAIKRQDGSYTMIDPTWMPYAMGVWSPAEGEQHYVIGSPEGEGRMAIRSYSAAENLTTVDLKGTLNEKGDLEGTITVQALAYGDTRLRRVIAYTPAQNRERMFAGWLANMAPNAEFISAKYGVLDDLSKPLVLEIRFRAPNYALKADGFMLYSPAAVKVAQAAPRPFQLVPELKSEERETLLMVWNPRQVIIREAIALPSGYAFEETPEKVKVGDEIASCAVEADLQKGVLSSKVDYIIAERTIPPENYAPVKKSYDAVKDFASAVWQLKKGS